MDFNKDHLGIYTRENKVTIKIGEIIGRYFEVTVLGNLKVGSYSYAILRVYSFLLQGKTILSKTFSTKESKG